MIGKLYRLQIAKLSFCKCVDLNLRLLGLILKSSLKIQKFWKVFFGLLIWFLFLYLSQSPLSFLMVYFEYILWILFWMLSHLHSWQVCKLFQLGLRFVWIWSHLIINLVILAEVFFYLYIFENFKNFYEWSNFNLENFGVESLF